MTEKQMINETLKRLREMKSLHRRYPNAWDKFILDGLTTCENLTKQGEFEHELDLFTAVTAVPESIIKFGADLRKPREKYSAKQSDGLFDGLLEKHFGKGALFPQIGELSDALTKLRSKLLDNDGKAALERLSDVRAANSELPEIFGELQVLMTAAAEKIEALIRQGEIEHACDLSDAVHALPEIAAAPKADLRAFKKCFVKPFVKKWNDSFFDDFDLQVFRVFSPRNGRRTKFT